MSNDRNSQSDASDNGEVSYEVCRVGAHVDLDSAAWAAAVAQEIASMVKAGRLPMIGDVEADSSGRVRLSVDAAAAVVIAESFAQEPGAILKR